MSSFDKISWEWYYIIQISTFYHDSAESNLILNKHRKCGKCHSEKNTMYFNFLGNNMLILSLKNWSFSHSLKNHGVPLSEGSSDDILSYMHSSWCHEVNCQGSFESADVDDDELSTTSIVLLVQSWSDVVSLQQRFSNVPKLPIVGIVFLYQMG